MQYTIVTAHQAQLLSEKVSEKIQEGWVPQGGASVTNAATIIFSQAMVKE